jgi:hypothetical protein
MAVLGIKSGAYKVVSTLLQASYLIQYYFIINVTRQLYKQADTLVQRDLQCDGSNSLLGLLFF